MSTNPTSGGSWIRDPVTGELTPNNSPSTGVDALSPPAAPAEPTGPVAFPFSGSSVAALAGLPAPDDAAGAAPTDDAAGETSAARRKKG